MADLMARDDQSAQRDDLEVVGFHEFLPTTDDIVAARHFVHDTLHAQDMAPDLVAAAELVVEEFAMNAVRHAGSYFSVVIACRTDAQVVRVAVRDDSNVFPAVREHVLLSITGWGLSLVASTADEWGAESLGRGKEVWALLHADT